MLGFVIDIDFRIYVSIYLQKLYIYPTNISRKLVDGSWQLVCFGLISKFLFVCKNSKLSCIFVHHKIIKQMHKYNFLIAAPSSGAGKTTATIGLLRALHKRLYNVQAFKAGPDYIDPKFHELATGRASINLDRFFCDTNEISKLFALYSDTAQVSVIEGVMGLFDGYDEKKGSSADLAKTLKIPIILLVNGASVAYSIAALLYGFKNFDPELNIAGVIFNKVSSASHYKIMQEAAKSVGLTALGHIPRKNDIIVPSRHLGLNIDTKYRFIEYADMLAEHIEKYVDIDLLLEKTKVQISRQSSIDKADKINKSFRIAIAHDEAFNFIYPETIRLFETYGELVFFSPIADKQMPITDYVYLPGGYPEFYLKELSSNKSMLNSVKDYADNNGKILAECGGMLYLCKSMIDKNGQSHSLVGFLDMQASMQNMKLKLGYRMFTYKDVIYKGHEFHYSSLMPNSYKSVCQQFGAKAQKVETKLFKQKNTIASYTHLYLKTFNDFENLF